MASGTPTISFSFLVMLLLGVLAPISDAHSSDLKGLECLKVSSSDFRNSVQGIIGLLQRVVSIFSRFPNGRDFRLSNAINDCIDLLDLSFDDLQLSASATDTPAGQKNGTGNLGSDLRTWLSAALANPQTCMEGFEGINSIVDNLVSSLLSQMISSIQQLLTQVHHGPDDFPTSNVQFPSWIKPRDQKILQSSKINADVVVAADGTGTFTRVADAVEAAPDYSMKRFVIYVKRGVYKENVEIKKKKWNIMMIGEGMDATLITGNRNFIDGWTTYRSATFAVNGRGFIARDITFRNTAGPQKHQAVALRSGSDLSVFYRCGIYGYQDSLFTHTMRQFYRECRIKGTVDFIFGDATVVFQKCEILAKKGLPGQKNAITAQGRKDQHEPTGFSFQFCEISADSDLLPFVGSTETYLGRPWKAYSRTIYMQTYINDLVDPRGWLEWNGDDSSLDTLYYAEYMNGGPGAALENRVKWPGFHVLRDAKQAYPFTVANFIQGGLWLPHTGVIFTAGLNG
ncbi:pectinesterase/pectinesterase inhibitor PPE8B-like [Neltuma alba]|uniref:pectinesterase/pectinesterase inhibitor PPE8B-like n=1 Tax=Neltuma alba TaxID=207710 RepID=UPI0010A448F4|nr:pectinesterase/pectinesterase inhibitor PPE8B-like [Prosopis alba]XP_028790533.1 pectinesterase/pectinesterase inhibitor PPE8B-like [Prosopis alba]